MDSFLLTSAHCQTVPGGIGSRQEGEVEVGMGRCSLLA